MPGLALLLAATPAGAEVRLRLLGTETTRASTPAADPLRHRETRGRLSRVRDGRTRFDLRHRYSVFGLYGRDGADPATNGHVHELAPGWRGHNRRWRWRLAPVLAVSSNVLKQPGEIRLADWRLHGAATRVDGPWRYGLRADSRFGAYRLYPFFRWKGGGGRLRYALGLPDARVGYGFAPALHLRLATGPDGGLWHVRDEDYRHRTRLTQQRWRTSLALRWTPVEALALSAGAARYHDRRWSWRLLDGRRVERDLPAVTAVFAALRVRW